MLTVNDKLLFSQSTCVNVPSEMYVVLFQFGHCSQIPEKRF